MFKRKDLSMLSTAALLVLCLISIVGDYFLKRASQEQTPFLSIPFVLGLTSYVAAAIAWTFALRELKLVTVGPIYAAFTVVMLAIIGVVFFKESLSWREIAGMGFAVVSIVLMAHSA